MAKSMGRVWEGSRLPVPAAACLLSIPLNCSWGQDGTRYLSSCKYPASVQPSGCLLMPDFPNEKSGLSQVQLYPSTTLQGSQSCSLHYSCFSYLFLLSLHHHLLFPSRVPLSAQPSHSSQLFVPEDSTERAPVCVCVFVLSESSITRSHDLLSCWLCNWRVPVSPGSGVLTVVPVVSNEIWAHGWLHILIN